jgi:hypothetical protein
MVKGYTEIDGESALLCELIGIPVKHYDTTFKITNKNLEKAARLMLQYQMIQIKPTQRYLREYCRF